MGTGSSITVTPSGSASSGAGPYGAGTPGTKTAGIQEAVRAAAITGGGSVAISPGDYSLQMAVHLTPSVDLVFDRAVVHCPASQPAMFVAKVSDVHLTGQGLFLAGAPSQVGIVVSDSRRISLAGRFGFSGWNGPNGGVAVICQGTSDAVLSGWETADSALLMCLGGTNIEVGGFRGGISPKGPVPSKAFVHVGTSAAYPSLSGVYVHDLVFDGGGLLDVSFVRVRLDQAEGRSGANVTVQRLNCRMGLPTSVWSDAFDSYGIDGCTISNIQAEGCYTGVSVANSRATISDCRAINCYSQGLQMGGPGQLGPISDIIVSNFVAQGCCRSGNDNKAPVVNGQLYVGAARGTIDNLRLVGCTGQALGAPNSLHGLCIQGAGLRSCSIEGGSFGASAAGSDVFIAPTVPLGTVRRM